MVSLLALFEANPDKKADKMSAKPVPRPGADPNAKDTEKGEPIKPVKDPEPERQEPLMKVLTKDFEKLRETYTVGIIGGANPAAYPKLVPKGELWIEQTASEIDQAAFLVHELVEFALMTKGEKSYAVSHGMANKLEKVFRSFKAQIKVKLAPDPEEKPKAKEPTPEKEVQESVSTNKSVPATSLYSPAWKIQESVREVEDGKTSKTTGPLRVSRCGKNRYFVMDGNHRVIEGIQAGKTAFDVVLDKYVPDMERTAGAYDNIIASAVQMVPEIKKNLTSKKKLEEAVAPKVAQTETPAFKAWFTDSKVVNKEGKPAVMYHSTPKTFIEFSMKHVGKTSKNATAHMGYFFASHPEGTEEYIQKPGKELVDGTIRPGDFVKGASIKPVYLNIKNPYRMSWKSFATLMATLEYMSPPEAVVHIKSVMEPLRAKFDGIHMEGWLSKGEKSDNPTFKHDFWVAFEPTQIKSAIGNKGTFNPKNPKISETVNSILDQAYPDLINETYSSALSSFLSYLNAGIDPYDFAHLLGEYFGDRGMRKPKGYDEDYPFDFLETTSFAKMKADFIEYLEANVQADSAIFPTYMFLTGAKLVPRQTWLIHFSDDADDIALNGFRYGADDFRMIGLTTMFKNRKKGPGWNFAFRADSRDAKNAARGRSGDPKYGKHAVLFQSAGVEAYHHGDEEHQVVFWGPSVKERYYLYNDDNTGEWSISGEGKGNLLKSGTFEEVVDWVEENHQQYRKVTVNRFRPKPIQPTPTKDRAKLLAKQPEPETLPFEGEKEPKWGMKGGRFITPEHKKKKKKLGHYEIYKSIPTNPPQAVQVAQGIGESVQPDPTFIAVTKGDVDHPEGHKKSDFDWKRVKAYPIKNLVHLMPGGITGWKDWLSSEMKDMPGEWDELAKTKEITDPIVVSPGHIWDGWHRVAAAVVNGIATVPAVVGTKK